MKIVFAFFQTMISAIRRVMGIRQAEQQATDDVGRRDCLIDESPGALDIFQDCTRTATHILKLSRQLREDNAQWPQIFTAINSADDPFIEAALIALRGPHRFLPHVAINILEEGCQNALAANLDADDVQALQEAVKSAGLVLHFGN